MKKVLVLICLSAFLSCDLFVEDENRDNPEPPFNVLAEVFYHGIKISWSRSNRNEKFNLFRKEAEGEWRLIAEDIEEESFIDESPLDRVDLYYGVQGIYMDKTSEIISTTEPIKIDLGAAIEVPTEVKAVVSQENVKISWEKSNNAKNYKVYIKYNEHEWSPISELLSNLEYIHNDPVEDKEVLYGVKAEFGGVYSAISQIPEMVKFIHTPDIPTNLKISNKNNKALISWDAVDNANNYRVYRRDNSSEWVSISELITETSFLDETINFDNTLYYAVKAEFQGMLSDFSTNSSNIRFVSKPQNINTAILETDVTISWDGIADNKYNLYKKIGDGEWYKLNTQLLEATTFVDSTPVFNKDIYYGVEAIYESSTSDLETTVTAIKLLSDMVFIKNFKVHSLQNVNSIRLSWNKFKESVKYNIYRSDTKESLGNKIGSTYNLFYTDSAVIPGTVYYYRVTWSIDNSDITGGGSIPALKGFCYTVADTKEPIDNDKNNITEDNIVLNSCIDSVIYKVGDDRDVDWYRYTVPPRKSHKIVTEIDSGILGVGLVSVYQNNRLYSEQSIPYMDLLLNNNTSEPMIFYIRVSSEISKIDNFIEKYHIKITQEL